ncbi:pyridoxal phosphate enzyme, YggS family [Luminiphilus syltensis NOR5-1B]|uniref:Pyridoxal phosphate homeostasis protein n=1 Tax=Luminiphilus syltensis NOR5-1B TaxID=565045 RepID=B8KU76_9GAMM|nr:pyridoxal phosphate enzyme, YggS family [Luminiphilus syltensis NOR5-1B]
MDAREIATNVSKVRDRIADAAAAAGRDPECVALLAVSKTKPAAMVRAAAEAGLHAFGENYLQDAETKIEELRDLGLEWHFIGPLQSNKTRTIAANFDWVHSVDRLKIARRLSEQRPEALGPLNICLQVNISGEPSKSGVLPGQVPDLAATVASLPGITLRGLMAIPAPETDPVKQRQPFAALRHLLESLSDSLPHLDTLSMGMSSDLEAAIAEGATIVRVGTDLFGARQ